MPMEDGGEGITVVRIIVGQNWLRIVSDDALWYYRSLNVGISAIALVFVPVPVWIGLFIYLRLLKFIS
jgi:hypothetical protein